MSVTHSAPTELADNPDHGLADLLLRAATKHPRSGVYVGSGEQLEAEFLTYPELLEEARRILGGLQGFELRPQSKVVLLLAHPRDFIPAFWACVLGGFVSCPMARTGSDLQRWERHVSHVDTLLERPLFISTGKLLGELPDVVSSTRLDTLRLAAPHKRVHHGAPSDPALLMLTSGSTGNSKAVELTHRNVLASMAAKAARHDWSSTDIALNWVGFDHVAALLECHMIALYVGATQIHVGPAEVLADPLLFLRLIDRYRATITFAPNFLLGQINSAFKDDDVVTSGRGLRSLDLSCMRRILTGGEANVVQTGLRFLELLRPYGLTKYALCPIYGLTETCAAVVYSLEFPDLDLEREFATVGLTVSGLDLRIVDESGRLLRDGEAGEVQVRGPIVFRRYYNNSEATRSAFTDDGWFRTGDLGRVDDGRLTIVARIKDSIIVSGVNYFSHELEAQLQSLVGIERSFVAAFPTRPKGADTEQLVIAFSSTLPKDDEAALHQLLVAIRNTTIMLWGFRPAAIVPLPNSAFPKTSLGKIQRSLMRQRFEAGAYDSERAYVTELTRRQVGAHVLPETPLETAILRSYAVILGVDPTTLSTRESFFDLGGTSLDILKLTRALDRELGARLDLPSIIKNPSVRGLAALISANAQERSVAYDPIVPLQTSGSGTPLFCVHPGNSEVLVLVNLAKYFLNDRPFFALRARGFNKGEECFQTLQEMVDTYVAAILARQPRGPFAIAGYSMGVGIAFEIAKRLEALSHRVAFLGAIDYIPHNEKITVDFTAIATAVAWVLELISTAQRDLLRTEIPGAPETVETCEYILRFAPKERLIELNLDLNRFLTWSRVAYVTEKLLYDNLTSGQIRAMTVFCSSGVAELATGSEWRQQLGRWAEFTAEPLRIIDVPGDHYSLMSPKHVAVFQALLRAEIDRSFRLQ